MTQDAALSELFDEKGRLKQFLPLDKMSVDNGQMHFLVCPGLGDLAWVMAKFIPLKDRCTFWFNNDQYKRQSQYADMLGIKYDFCDVDIARLYEAPGEFSEQEITDGGFIGYLHANTHIESGKRIEDWHPFLPRVNPAPFGRWGGFTYRNRIPQQITVHMASANYQEGNWPPKAWAKALRHIEENYGPVTVVGAFWDTKFAERVFETYQPANSMLDQPLADVIETIRTSRAMIGFDSGICILAKYMGVPTMQYYPKWLRTDTPSARHPNGTNMPGSWEFDAHPKSGWGFVEDALDRDHDSYFGNWLDTL